MRPETQRVTDEIFWGWPIDEPSGDLDPVDGNALEEYVAEMSSRLKAARDLLSFLESAEQAGVARRPSSLQGRLFQLTAEFDEFCLFARSPSPVAVGSLFPKLELLLDQIEDCEAEEERLIADEYRTALDPDLRV